MNGLVLGAPFTVPNAMPNEACFLYVLEGSQRIHSANHKELLKQNDAVLMKCGMYFGEWLSSAEYKQCEAIVVHLYPEVLKKIYESEIPDFIKKYKKAENQVYLHKVTDNALIENYIISMQFYFENPQLVDDELIKLKLKEFDVSPEAAWKVIGAVDGVDKWFAPMITSCRIEVNKRICRTDTGEFTEGIEKVDHANRVFQYTIPEQQFNVLVKNIFGTMQVSEANNGKASIEWSWKFDVNESEEQQAKEMFAGAGAMGIAGIERLIKSTQ